MNNLYCSTGIITHYPHFPSHMPIIEYKTQICADAYELMIFPSWYQGRDQIVRDFKHADLSFPVVHADKRLGSMICESDSVEYRKAMDIFSINCQIAKDLESDMILIHLWGLPCSDNTFDVNLKALGRFLNIAHRHRLALLVESIPCSLKTPLHRLKEVTSQFPACGIVLDLRLIAYHDQIDALYEADWIWENPLVHFHFNDYKGAAFNMEGGTHPGKGNIDYDILFAFLSKIGFTGSFTLEAASLDEHGNIELDRLNRSLELTRRYIERI